MEDDGLSTRLATMQTKRTVKLAPNAQSNLHRAQKDRWEVNKRGTKQCCLEARVLTNAIPAEHLRS